MKSILSNTFQMILFAPDCNNTNLDLNLRP